MKQELAIHLRIYKGKTLSKDEKGKYLNENHIVTLIHDTAEYKKFLSLMNANGIIKAEIERVLDLNSVNESKTKSDPDYYNSVENFADLQKEIDAALNPELKKELTADQKRIADLEAKLEALIGGRKATPELASVADLESKLNGGNTELPAKKEVAPELADARRRFKEIVGEKGSAKWTVEEINQKIEDHILKSKTEVK